MKLSIIIPTFNEKKTIQSTIKEVIRAEIPQMTKEIIVVDDGSIDGSIATLQDPHIKNNITIYRHKKNYGKGQAVITGIKYATGDYILIQDADAEYHPKEIPRLLTPILEGKTQVVYGTRLARLPSMRDEIHSGLYFKHYIGNKLLSLLTSLLFQQWITDMETGYKIFPKKAVTSMTIHAKGFEFEPEITAKLLKAGYKITEIPITTVPRSYKEGKKINTVKDGIKALVTLFKYRFSD